MFAGLGFNKVSTYIQSGNITFDADTEAEPNFLSTKIKLRIEETFGYDVPVIIRTPSNLENSLNSFPFDNRKGWKRYISFLSSKPMPKQVEELEKLSSDIEQFKVRETELFSIVDKQTDKKPLFSNSFVEHQLGIPATTRNMRTVNKMLELASVSD